MSNSLFGLKSKKPHFVKQPREPERVVQGAWDAANAIFKRLARRRRARKATMLMAQGQAEPILKKRVLGGGA